LFKTDSVTSGARSAIPDWLAKRKAKSLKNDQGKNYIDMPCYLGLDGIAGGWIEGVVC
jgi:hypothetical protein